MKNSVKRYTIDLSLDDESGAFVASCREIPACMVINEKRDLAVQMVYEAIEDHLNYRFKTKKSKINKYKG
jgi:predicted RNase H-like HicB family nuclease